LEAGDSSSEARRRTSFRAFVQKYTSNIISNASAGAHVVASIALLR
jgi:hypothetical protein